MFYIGPHAPALSPDDVQLVHRLWLNMRRDPSVQDLHHSDIITYALTRLAGQYAREKAEILRDLRNYRPPTLPCASDAKLQIPAKSAPLPAPSSKPATNKTRRRLQLCHPAYLLSCHPERSAVPARVRQNTG